MIFIAGFELTPAHGKVLPARQFREDLASLPVAGQLTANGRIHFWQDCCLEQKLTG